MLLINVLIYISYLIDRLSHLNHRRKTAFIIVNICFTNTVIYQFRCLWENNGQIHFFFCEVLSHLTFDVWSAG